MADDSTLVPDSRAYSLRSAAGENIANALHAWLEALHMAAVWGLPYRIAVSLLGLGITMLSVTGVLIWMKKRSAQIARKARAPALS